MLQMFYEDEEEEAAVITTPITTAAKKRSLVRDNGPEAKAKVSKKGVRDPATRLRDDYAASPGTGGEVNPQAAAKIDRIGRRGTPLGREVNPLRKVMSDFKGPTRCRREECTISFPPNKVFRPHGGSGWKTDCYCKTTTYRGVKDLVVPLTPDVPIDL